MDNSTEENRGIIEKKMILRLTNLDRNRVGHFSVNNNVEKIIYPRQLLLIELDQPSLSQWWGKIYSVDPWIKVEKWKTSEIA